MGTSANHPGSGPNSLLVPPWADPENDEPSPPADPKRFKQFRTELGKFAATGSTDSLQSALRNFASKSMGGSAAGGRRFTAMAGAGANAILAFAGPGGIGAALQQAGVNLDALRGADINTLIEAIARAFASENEDHDKVEAALRGALVVVLEHVPDFDIEHFAGFTDDQYIELVAAYLENCVCEHILAEGEKAMDKAATPVEQLARERELRTTVRTAIGQHLQPAVDAGITTMNRDRLIGTQRAIVEAVLRSWEEYDG